jgi:hypothetical protein
MEQIYTPFVRLPNIIMDLMITVFSCQWNVFISYLWLVPCKYLYRVYSQVDRSTKREALERYDDRMRRLRATVQVSLTYINPCF